jgi:hypothetical protein
MKNTPQEKKAQKLWAGYEGQDEESFWEKYESLIKEASVAGLPTYIAQQKIQVATEPPSTQKPQVYGNYRKQNVVRAGISGLLATPAILVFNDIHLPLWGGLLFYGWIGFLSFAVSRFFNYPSFQITKSRLVVHKGMKKEKIRWSVIDNIIKQEEITLDEEGDPHISYSLIINTYRYGEYQVFKYKYKFPDKVHTKFFEHLRQYVPHVHERKADS